MRKPLIPLVLIVLAAAATGAWWWTDGRQVAPADTVTLYGNVEVREVVLAFTVAGRLADLAVDEGDAVEQGAVLGHLDRERFRAALDAAEADLAAQRAVLAELEAGTRAEEIARAEAAVDEARATLANAETQYRRLVRLEGNDFASQSALDDARTARDQAAARLRRAEEDLALARAGPREETIAAARARVAALEARVALAREDLDDTALVAPSDGRILTRVHEPGAVLGAGTPVLTQALTDPVWIRAYLPEPMLGRVVPGATVEVTSDSFPDRRYQGRVGYVSPTAEFTPKTVETPDLRTSLVYRVRIVVDQPGDQLRQGMPVTLSIPLAPREAPGPASVEDGA
jgi:HlyD family secretion protein